MSRGNESHRRREDRLNGVVIQLLKITSTAKISPVDGTEIGIRLAAGIALDATQGDREKAAALLEDLMAWMVAQIRNPITETREVVKDGEVIN